MSMELIDNHEHEWYEYAGDVTTSLIPLVTTSLLLKNAGYTKPQVFNKLGDVLKGNGSVSLNVSDVFNSRKRMSLTSTETFISDSEFQFRVRTFNLSFIF